MSSKKDSITMIETRGLSKYFPITQTMALHKVSITIKQGDFVAITGPSGSGKSTILNLFAGLHDPTEGMIYFCGTSLNSIKNKSLFRRKNIGFIFQNFYLYPGFSVLENVLLPLTHAIFVRKHWTDKAKKLLKYLHMSEKIEQEVNNLSAGERQRVCIARALLLEPSVIIADEPTGSLDHNNSEIILDILKRINKEQNTTIIMASHDEQAITYSKRNIKLVDGKLIN